MYLFDVKMRSSVAAKPTSRQLRVRFGAMFSVELAALISVTNLFETRRDTQQCTVKKKTENLVRGKQKFAIGWK